MVARSGLDASTANEGLYLVLLEAAAPIEVTVGKLGTFDFPAGRYVYVGSARRGLRARAGRHLRREKPLRWHIDYLTTHPGVRTIGAVLVAAPPRRLTECRLGHGVRRALGARPVVPRFGAGDCRAGCAAHLWWVGPAASSIGVVRDGSSAGPDKNGRTTTRPHGRERGQHRGD